MDRLWTVLFETWHEEPGVVTEALLRECYELHSHTQFETERAPVISQMDDAIVRAVDAGLADVQGDSR